MEIITAMATAIGGILSAIAVSPVALGAIAIYIIIAKVKHHR